MERFVFIALLAGLVIGMVSCANEQIVFFDRGGDQDQPANGDQDQPANGDQDLDPDSDGETVFVDEDGDSSGSEDELEFPEADRDDSPCLHGPCIAAGPNPMDFGTVHYGSSTKMALNIQNIGTGTLHIFIMDFEEGTDPDFSWNLSGDDSSPTDEGPILIEAGEIAQVDVFLTSSGPGTKQGQIAIRSSAVNVFSPTGLMVEVSCRESGITELVVDPEGFSHDFGQVEVNAPSPAERQITITNRLCAEPEDIRNQANRLLSVGPITFEPEDQDDFSIDTTSFDPSSVRYIRQCESLSFIVNFHPANIGEKAVKLVIQHDATNYPEGQRPAEILLTGRGLFSGGE